MISARRSNPLAVPSFAKAGFLFRKQKARQIALHFVNVL